MWLARASAPVATWLCRRAGTRPLYTSDSLEVLRTANRHMRCDKAARELEFRPRPLRATVADVYAWLEEAALL